MYAFKYFNNKQYSPLKNNYTGQVYVLTGGYSFSATTLFAAAVKGQKNVTIVGEETGGGYYGNSSGSFLSFTLPNTGITGRIPLCKFVIEPKINTIPFGRGVLPDYEIQPSIKEYLSGYDNEMEYAKLLIKKN